MSSTQPLEERTEAVHRELKSMRRHFRVAAWITLIVGSLLVALVAFYFAYGYSEISDLRDPEKIVALVGQTVDDQLPIIRERLETEVKNNASSWAEQSSQQLLAAIPPMRQQLEQLALRQSDAMIAKIDVVGEQQFRRILDENRSTVQQAIEDVKNDQDVSKDVLAALQLAIEKELQIDGSSQAEAVFTIVSDMNRNLGELKAGKDLTREQKAERRVLMLAKRLQKERFGDVKLDELSLPVVDEIVGDMEQKRLRRETAEATAQPNATEAVKQSPADGPTTKPVKEKAAAVEKKPAALPEKTAKPADPADKPADKPEEAAKAADKPADKPEDADKPEKADKPADKPED